MRAIPWSVFEELAPLKANPLEAAFGTGTNLFTKPVEIGLKKVVPMLPKAGFEQVVTVAVIALPQLKMAPVTPVPKNGVPARWVLPSSPFIVKGVVLTDLLRATAFSAKLPALWAGLSTVTRLCVAVAL